MREYYVYIMTNGVRTFYIGVTSDLARRVYEHKQKLVDGFTKKYNITFLVYFDVTSDVVEQSLVPKDALWLRQSCPNLP